MLDVVYDERLLQLQIGKAVRGKGVCECRYRSELDRVGEIEWFAAGFFLSGKRRGLSEEL